ncbi:MAG: beta strand repeat-containing protein, partial [Planctomycetota bacterium]
MFGNLFEPRSRRITARKGLGRRPVRFVGRDMQPSRVERLETRQVLAAFTAGNLVIERLGNGSTVLGSGAINVAIQEFSPAGTAAQTLSFGSTAGAADLLTDSGSSTSNGYANAYNGFVSVPGYNSAAGTVSVSALNTKVNAVLGSDGNAASRTLFPTGGAAATPPSPFAGNNYRSSIATSGTTFYAAGTGSGTPATGGVWYYDGSAFTQVSSIATGQPTNARNVEIYGGQLYFSSSSTTGYGIFSVGTGLPTAAGQTSTLAINTNGSGTGTASPYGFVLFDTDNNGAADLAYIADDRTSAGGGLQKWTLSGSTWTNSWSLLVNATNALSATAATGFAGLRGLTGSFSGGVATLYATTNETSNNRVIQISDNGTTPTTATAVATAGVNYVFRGLDVFTAASTTPTIVGVATAAAFTTTYGTASTPQSFNVAGSSLTADLVATAPTGFEVSSDGTNYGPTATFARSGSSASGTLRVRLAATAAVGGSYNAQNIVLSSTGATSRNIVTATTGNTVTAKGLAITGLTAQDKNFDGGTSVTVTGTPAYDGLANGETFAVTGTVTWAFADATVGAGKALVRTGSYDAPSGNYTVTQPVLTASIIATAPTAPTINAITPGSGQLSVAFSPPASNGGQAITGYEYSTDGGTSFTAAGTTSSPIVITGLTNGTTYDVQLRAVNSVGSGAASTTVQGTPAAAASPAITVSGLSGTFSTVYGTASASQSFTVSGAALVGDLTVTAPTGLEVSTSAGSGFADSLTLTPAAGAVASTTVYVRLKATAAAGAYNSRSISATSSGATTQTVSTDVAGNIVSPKAITVTGLSGTSRTYDQTTSVVVSGTPEYSGLANGETFAVSGTVTWAFADKIAGDAKPLVRTGDYQAPSGNYTVTQPTLTATITAAALTTTGAAAQSRAYNGTAIATITGATLVGVIAGDDVTIATSTGTFASANVGTAIAVAGGLTLVGVDGGNYSVTQPTGLTADITKATQTIAFGPFGPQVVGGTVTATASSGLAVSYTISDASVASVAGASVALNAIGGITVTASQAGDSNYDAATTVTRTFKVIANAATTLAAGDIAVIGYDTGGSPTDNFSILVLKDLGPGTVFYVNDNEVATGGTSFIDMGEAEATFTVQPGQVIAAGTVINLPWGSATVTDPRFTWLGHSSGGLGGSNDELFVYTGTSATALTPTAFIYGVKIGTSTQGAPAGLVDGVTFIAPSQARARYLTAGAVYAGTPTELRAAIGDTFNNWETAGTNTGWIETSVWNFSLPAVQAITFDALASRTYGDAAVQLVATASSGLPVTFVSSDPTIASVSGTTLTILKAGTVTITASQAGDASYEAASSVARSLVISPKAITVTADAKSKVYGEVDPTCTYQVTGLVGSDSLTGSLARASGVNVGTYAIGQGTLSGAGNYAIAFTGADLTVTAKTLTVTASNVNKPFGTTLTGGPGSTSFTSVGLVAGETIGSVTVAYGLGAASGAAVGTYTGSVTVSDATGGTFLPSNYSIGYAAGDIVVSNDPTISIGGSIGAMTTTYGTASTAAAFSVSGGFLSGNLTVAAPAGFEVSTIAGSGYGGTVTLSPTSGSVSATTVYVRLAATTAAGDRSGSVSVSGGGATTQTLAIATSSVAQKVLTIGGLSAANRGYDGSTTGTVTGTPTYVGLVNAETFSVTDVVTWSFGSKSVGVGKPLTASGNYSAPSANYLVTQPTFAADITARALTVTGAAAVNKAYDGTIAATITGASLVGVVAGDVVTIATSSGSFASAGVGTGIAVTAGLVLDGADSGNYTLT